MSAVQGVVFDAYGTLFDVHSIAKTAEQLFPQSGAAISTLWRDKQIEYSRLVSLADPSPAGSRHYQPFWELTQAALQYSLDKLGLAHGAPEVDALMNGYARLDAYPECLAVLQAVKARGLTTAILSNGSPAMLQAAASSSGLAPWLDHMISVDAVRHYKTTPMSYALGPSTLNAPAESLVFVSSNGWDVVGATWYGYSTCWVNRQNAPIEKLGAPPRHICASLEGVLDLL